MRRGRRRSVPKNADLVARIGHNPARFLATRSDSGAATGQGDSPELALAKAVIKGIDDIETLDAWQDVEVDLGLNDGGPRKIVISWLNCRRSVLTGTCADNADVGLAPEPTLVEQNELSTATVDEESSTSSATEVVADGGSDDPRCADCGAALEREVITGEVGWWCGCCKDHTQQAAVAA